MNQRLDRLGFEPVARQHRQRRLADAASAANVAAIVVA